MKKPQLITTRAKRAFALACFFFACYFTATQFALFSQNRDSSSIAYKPFNLSPTDKYPTFSICLKGYQIYWQQEKFLFDTTGATSSQYTDILRGAGTRYKYDEETRLYLKESVGLDNISTVSFDQMLLNPTDLFVEVDLFAYDDRQSTHYVALNKGSNSSKLPFNIAYQTAEEICFSRDSKDEIDLTRDYDLISLSTSLLQPGNHLDLELRVITHYPGQLLRSFDNPSYSSTLASHDKQKLLDLKVSHVTTLRKRPTSNVPCNDKIENDDMVLIEEIISLSGCIPPYWKHLVPNNQKYIGCHSTEQLQNVSRAIESYRSFFSNYEEPCVDMTAMVIINKDVSQDHEKNFKVKITYTEDVYLEIENLKEFSFETFFSGVGGLIGIFLGYSILQIPEILCEIAHFLRGKQGRITVRKYFFIFQFQPFPIMNTASPSQFSKVKIMTLTIFEFR